MAELLPGYIATEVHRPQSFVSQLGLEAGHQALDRPQTAPHEHVGVRSLGHAPAHGVPRGRSVALEDVDAIEVVGEDASGQETGEATTETRARRPIRACCESRYEF